VDLKDFGASNQDQITTRQMDPDVGQSHAAKWAEAGEFIPSGFSGPCFPHSILNQQKKKSHIPKEYQQTQQEVSSGVTILNPQKYVQCRHSPLQFPSTNPNAATQAAYQPIHPPLIPFPSGLFSQTRPRKQPGKKPNSITDHITEPTRIQIGDNIWYRLPDGRLILLQPNIGGYAVYRTF
jgi:hypothetical protein